jgi:hypothetical protein
MEHAAIILHKLGREDEEVLVPKRWLALCPPEHRDGSRIGQRLAKPGWIRTKPGEGRKDALCDRSRAV